MRTSVDLLVPLAPLLRALDEAPAFHGWTRVLIGGVLPTFLVYWLFSFIPVVGTLIYLLGVVPAAAYLHVRQVQSERPINSDALFLRYFVVIAIGFGGIWGFIGHTLLADHVAEGIGWETGSPFQIELAFYHLGLGIVALGAVWMRDSLVIGLTIAKSVFWLGAAGVHLHEILIHDNLSPYNAGGPLIGDIVLPAVMLTLAYRSIAADRASKGADVTPA